MTKSGTTAKLVPHVRLTIKQWRKRIRQAIELEEQRRRYWCDFYGDDIERMSKSLSSARSQLHSLFQELETAFSKKVWFGGEPELEENSILFDGWAQKLVDQRIDSYPDLIRYGDRVFIKPSLVEELENELGSIPKIDSSDLDLLEQHLAEFEIFVTKFDIEANRPLEVPAMLVTFLRIPFKANELVDASTE